VQCNAVQSMHADKTQRTPASSHALSYVTLALSFLLSAM